MGKQQRMKGMVAVCLLFWVTIIVLPGSQAVAGQKCRELVKKRCQNCHSLTRICEGLGRDKESWQQTIANMADYASAITEKEQKVMVKCLAKQEKDVVELCRH